MNRSNAGWCLGILGLLAGLVGWGGCSRSNRTAQFQELADRYYQNRELEKAKIEYFNLLRAQPTNGYAILQLGKILLAQGQYLEAAPLVGWSRVRFPEDLETRERCIEFLLMTTGETNRIRLRREIDELLERQPANERAVLALAALAKTPQASVELAQRVTALRSKAGNRAIFGLVDAELARRRGDTNGCESALRAAVALEPTNATVHATFASYLFGQRRQAEGEAALRKAAEVAPPYAGVREHWARYLLQTGRRDEAKAVFDGIIEKAPERVSAWVGRTEIALAERKLDDAERFLGRALGQAPNDPESLRTLAQLRLAQGKPDDAIRELEKIVQRQPGSAASQYQLALAHLVNKDPARAEDALEQSVHLQPGFTMAALLLADLQLQRNGPVKAIATLNELLRNDPGNQQAHLMLIQAQRATGRDDNALAAATLALQRFPTNGVLAYQQGLILSRLRRWGEARSSFELADKHLTNALALEQLVRLDLAGKDVTRARQRIDARMATAPKDPALLLLKAETHFVQGENKQGIDLLEEVLRLDADNSLAQVAMARVLAAGGRLKDGVAGLETYLERKPGDAEAQKLLGGFYTGTGDYAAAAKAYEASLKAVPGQAEVVNNLALLLFEHLGRKDEGYQLALKARQLRPEDPAVADSLGWIEYQRGQFGEALRLISEAAGRMGTNPEIQYHLGMTHYMMGQEAAARTALAFAAGHKEDFPGKKSAAEFLAVLQPEAGQSDAARIAALEKRRQAAPNDFIALLRLGEAYEASGAAEKARDAWEAARQINGKSVLLLVRLANLYSQRLNNPTKSLEIARAARALEPRNAEVALTLGRLAFAAGDDGWAYTLLQESARQITNRVDLAEALGWAAFSQGKLEDAARHMKAAASLVEAAAPTNAPAVFLEMLSAAQSSAVSPPVLARVQAVLGASPDHAAALFAYAMLAERQGKFDGARDAHLRLLGRFKAFSPSTRQLAVLFAERLNDDAKAQEFGLKARQAYPQDDVLAAALGKAVCRKGDFKYAAQLLSEASRTRTSDPLVFYHLGVALQELKRNPEARTALETALKIEGNGAFAADARKRIEQLKKG